MTDEEHNSSSLLASADQEKTTTGGVSWFCYYEEGVDRQATTEGPV